MAKRKTEKPAPGPFGIPAAVLEEKKNPDDISLPPGFVVTENGLEVPDGARISAVWKTSWLNVKGQRVQVKG